LHRSEARPSELLEANHRGLMIRRWSGKGAARSEARAPELRRQNTGGNYGSKIRGEITRKCREKGAPRGDARPPELRMQITEAILYENARERSLARTRCNDCGKKPRVKPGIKAGVKPAVKPAAKPAAKPTAAGTAWSGGTGDVTNALGQFLSNKFGQQGSGRLRYRHSLQARPTGTAYRHGLHSLQLHSLQRHTSTAYRGTAYRCTADKSTAYRGTAYRGTAYRDTAYRGTAYRGKAYRDANFWVGRAEASKHANNKLLAAGMYGHLSTYHVRFYGHPTTANF
jgi:hypothetical protein